eukprot:TRINITY_DN276_c0_g1_i1.p1 TRINITY_DN276_c0_g1~~TRINITY_DN276_c0_g1_i1.p1  ORF type:complete len:297 (+),score=34.69 TRINITY_DN276_c0_g1_i1:23-892(+)
MEIPIVRSMPHVPNYGGYRPYIEEQLRPDQVARPMQITRPPPPGPTQDRAREVRGVSRNSSLYATQFAVQSDALQVKKAPPPDFFGSKGVHTVRGFPAASMYASTFVPHDVRNFTRPSTSKSISTAVGADKSLPLEAETIRPKTTPSLYTAGYGTYGSNPRSRSPTIPRDISMKSAHTDLYAGTSKVTHHIPGYTGFVPAAKYNDVAVQQGSATVTRAAPVDKAILRDTIVHNMPGYVGYRPKAAVNDRGPRQPNQRSMYGLMHSMPKLSTREPLIRTHFPIRSAFMNG